MEENFYTEGVRAEDFWIRCGVLLKDAREARQWDNWRDVELKGAGNPPTYKTIKNHEFGKIKKTDELERHARALDITLVDLFRSVLSKTEKPVSPESLKLLRLFERLGADERRALLRNAELFAREREP
jgi:hypothetical protein